MTVSFVYVGLPPPWYLFVAAGMFQVEATAPQSPSTPSFNRGVPLTSTYLPGIYLFYTSLCFEKPPLPATPLRFMQLFTSHLHNYLIACTVIGCLPIEDQPLEQYNRLSSLQFTIL